MFFNFFFLSAYQCYIMLILKHALNMHCLILLTGWHLCMSKLEKIFTNCPPIYHCYEKLLQTQVMDSSLQRLIQAQWSLNLAPPRSKMSPAIGQGIEFMNTPHIEGTTEGNPKLLYTAPSPSVPFQVFQRWNDHALFSTTIRYTK